MSNESGLISEDGEVKVSLKSVRLEGRVEGLLMTMKMRQRYVNESLGSIEAVYTFPAGWGSNLMGFNVEIAGKTLSSVCLPKKTAEEKYEKALEEGDTPVMVEATPQGLYTANLGNLKSGEEAIIEIEYAQVLRNIKGNIRITVPTVVGARYGDQEAQGGLFGHQKVGTNALIEYPLMVNLDVVGALAQGTLECPSHKVDISSTENGKRVQILNGAMLDRDFILNIEGIEANSFIVAAKEEDSYAMIASFCPVLPDSNDSPIALKILVDCSGSMEGDSIEQVRTAMDSVTQQLKENDYVSYSKFGSNVEHLNPVLEQATKKYIKGPLAKAIHGTLANLGGTEIKSALKSTYKLEVPSDLKLSVNVLLITDGDVWDVEAVIKSAIKNKHRIFAIGVGSAPAESLLRELAESTGGACELVSPNESIEAATLRMFNRMRSTHTDKISLNWEHGLNWRTVIPKQIFSNETVHIYANVKEIPKELPTLNYEINGVKHSCTAQSIDVQENSLIPRICASARLGMVENEKIETEIALKYQLVSKYTNLILVYERVDEDKSVGLPKLEQIAQMQAAGWGGFGRVDTYPNVRMCRSVYVNRPGTAPNDVVYSSMAVPSVWRTHKTENLTTIKAQLSPGEDNYEIPAFLRAKDDEFYLDEPKSPEIEIDKGFPPKSIIRFLNTEAMLNADLGLIIKQIAKMTKDSSIDFFIKDHNLGQESIEVYWCVILNWLSEHLQGTCALQRHAQRLVNDKLKNIDQSLKANIEADLLLKFDCIKERSWGTGRNAFDTLKSKMKKVLHID